jgi:acyl-CoA thioester hydrolase
MDNWSRQWPVIAEIPLRWSDMDAFGHVNNARYVTFIEEARIAYIQKMLGVTGLNAEGVAPILGSVDCRFLAPVVFPDTLLVGARVTEVRENRYKVEHEAWSQAMARVVLSGNSWVFCYDYDQGQSVSVPTEIRRAIAALEKTEETL